MWNYFDSWCHIFVCIQGAHKLIVKQGQSQIPLPITVVRQYIIHLNLVKQFVGLTKSVAVYIPDGCVK